MNKVTMQAIEANISQEYYFRLGEAVFPGDVIANADFDMYKELNLTTICVLVLNNGYKVTGQSTCVDPNTFVKTDGEKYAREDAIDKIWPLMGYELKTKLSKKDL